MRPTNLLSLLSFVSLAFGHGDHGGHAVDADQANIIPKLSLPNLVSVDSVDQLSADWDFRGEAVVDSGRIVLTPKATISNNNEMSFQHGSIWSKLLSYKEFDNQFSFEVTARSVGSIGMTHSGFSIWLIQDSKTSSNTDNMGGPTKFTGLQILIDSNDNNFKSVIRPYLNDGSKDIDLANDFIGAYSYEYQNSQVPFTFKFGYDKETNWLKLTIDNKLIFQTNEIDLTSIIHDKKFRLGVSGYSPKDMITYEQFEILMLKSYNSILSELLVDEKQTLFARHSQMALEEQLKEKMDAKMFRAKQKQLREQLELKTKAENEQKEEKKKETVIETQKDNVIEDVNLLNDINVKLQSLLDASFAIPQVDSSSSSSVSEEQRQIQLQQAASGSQQVQKQLFELAKSIKVLTEKSSSYQTQTESQLAQLTKLVKDQDSVIDQLSSQLTQLTSFFDTQLEQNQSLNEKLNAIQKQNLASLSSNKQQQTEPKVPTFNPNPINDSFESFKNTLKYCVIFLVLAIIVLTFIVSSLRSEIKHAKVF